MRAMPETGQPRPTLDLVRDSNCASDAEELVSRRCSLLHFTVVLQAQFCSFRLINVSNLSFVSYCGMSMYWKQRYDGRLCTSLT